jgi:pyridoxal phosphate enzyme (YggS family)
MSQLTQSLAANLERTRNRIEAAARRSGRDPEDVRLVAVTKRSSVEDVRPLVELGVSDLGENYPQELWIKARAMTDLPIAWHLIGLLQSNKARRTLPLVSVVHAVDSLGLLQRLDAIAAEVAKPPSVLLQVNCSSEPSKHGWSPESLERDAEAIGLCRRIPITGLMTMAALAENPERARPAFRLLRQTRDRVRAATGLALPDLSMGMSGDFEVAIEEGATYVRIGSALFEENEV